MIDDDSKDWVGLTLLQRSSAAKPRLWRLSLRLKVVLGDSRSGLAVSTNVTNPVLFTVNRR